MEAQAGEPEPGEPNEANGFLARHARLLRDSLRHWTGRDLLDAGAGDESAAARRLFEAPFAVLSHGIGPDPCFTYANRTALTLFAMTWSQMRATPSRLSAEAPDREARARLLAEVAARGFIDDYAGVRIARTGRRFVIRRATVWTLTDAAGLHVGQAATFGHWDWLD